MTNAVNLGEFTDKILTIYTCTIKLICVVDDFCCSKIMLKEIQASLLGQYLHSNYGIYIIVSS